MVSIPITELESHVGQVIGESPWTEISQERVNAFADATGDHQWIHVDVERARRESPWKSPVAHGFLTASLLPMLNKQVLEVTGLSATINYGLNKLRFPAAVKVGAEIRSRIKLVDLQRVDANRTLATYQTTIEIRGEDKPACVAENLAMYVTG
ncbi:MaoC family dehydratase [Marinobacter koreensis]|uniref:MaoC family dehydratase n=1 Tax=Marinobacter koreensis TaxID=335974 RepID=A0ABW0RPK8_9GAMM|nr:MaoC family dehydratase [Marinobacter koreensis]MBI43621.1 enoyl-CoA hydratase [Oceanospirillales bacterium]MCK7548793.1 MaoC family dehydratase [Marinobacter koreensis]MDX1816983.1 MaoC family dehydratase [Marinobacter sp.]|tara:strand:+ start:1759 stop:2217 length:459 start_codon:yes stop_codon:yes gene_type:complete